MLLLTGLSALSNAKPVSESDEKYALDPGGIRGPILGRLRGYEFCGNYDDHLKLNATRVLYFGIGYAFDSGFYPRFYRHREVTFHYPYFEGIITTTFIIGTISGLPQ